MAATTAEAGGEREPTEQEILGIFNSLRSEYQSVGQKINELEGERREHDLVLEALADLEDDRRCFRLIGGVLVERTVAQVKPAVDTNRKGIDDIIEQLKAQFEKKGREIQEFQAKYNIRIKKGNMMNESQGDGGNSGGGEEKQEGILV